MGSSCIKRLNCSESKPSLSHLHVFPSGSTCSMLIDAVVRLLLLVAFLSLSKPSAVLSVSCRRRTSAWFRHTQAIVYPSSLCGVSMLCSGGRKDTRRGYTHLCQCILCRAHPRQWHSLNSPYLARMVLKLFSALMWWKSSFVPFGGNVLRKRYEDNSLYSHTLMWEWQGLYSNSSMYCTTWTCWRIYFHTCIPLCSE